jgi:hypothetical protein
MNSKKPEETENISPFPEDEGYQTKEENKMHYLIKNTYIEKERAVRKVQRQTFKPAVFCSFYERKN